MFEKKSIPIFRQYFYLISNSQAKHINHLLVVVPIIGVHDQTCFSRRWPLFGESSHHTDIYLGIKTKLQKPLEDAKKQTALLNIQTHVQWGC